MSGAPGRSGAPTRSFRHVKSFSPWRRAGLLDSGVPRPSRLLIISASIGGGHVAAGRALETAAQEHGIDTLHVDLLDYTTVPFRRLYRQAYFDLVRTAPEMVDWLGRRLDQPPRGVSLRTQRVRARLTRLASYHLPRLIARHEPDALLHTHFLPPQVLQASTGRGDVPQAIVVTDYVAHRLWLRPGVDRYFVGADEVRVHLEAAGARREGIRVTGIPIDGRYARLPGKEEARATLGIPADRDTLLLMAGGIDRRPLQELVRQLRELRWPLTVLIVCGRSPELLGSAREAVGEPDGLVQFRTFGFTDEVPRMMAAADLITGKPGGLTVSEALAAGLPFVIVEPYPLQEEGNANYLLEHGAALRVDPLTTFSHKLKRFLQDEPRRRAMREAALRIARPGAADAVIGSLVREPLAEAVR